MPKIIDREAQKRNIALKSIPLFREKGYEAISFRYIAKELNISKSGLYHYFTDKKELFHFCGQLILQSGESILQADPDSTPLKAIMSIRDKWIVDFGDELRLLMDYKKYIDSDLDIIFKEMENLLTELVGLKRSRSLLLLIIGELTLGAIVSEKDQREKFEEALIDLLEIT